jgi:hypothetical protein
LLSGGLSHTQWKPFQQRFSGTCPGSQASCTWRSQTCLPCLCTRVHRRADTDSNGSTQTAVAFQFQKASFVLHASNSLPQLRASAPQPHSCHPAVAVVALAQQSGLNTHTRFLVRRLVGAHTRKGRPRDPAKGRERCPTVSETPALASTAARSRAREPATAAAALCYRARGVPTQAVALGAAEGAAEEGLASLGGAHAILPELRARLTGVALPPQTRVSTPRGHSTGCSARSRNWPPLSHGECCWLNLSRTARPAPSGRRARRISERRHHRACAL